MLQGSLRKLEVGNIPGEVDMSDDEQVVPGSDVASESDAPESHADASHLLQAPFYERPVWRASLIFIALVAMLGLLALVPSRYWRF